LNGLESVKEDCQSGRPVKVRTNENIKQIEELVQSDWHLGVRDISAQLNFARETGTEVLMENLGIICLLRCNSSFPFTISYSSTVQSKLSLMVSLSSEA
jgi:hypothetical protein